MEAETVPNDSILSAQELRVTVPRAGGPVPDQHTSGMAQHAQEARYPHNMRATLSQPRRFRAVPVDPHHPVPPPEMLPARILRAPPMGELLTSSGKRKYILWAASQQEIIEGSAIEVVINNTCSESAFTSYCGPSYRRPQDILWHFSTLLMNEGISLISLHVTEQSFEATISTNKGWDILGPAILRATVRG